jgi:adenylate kinase family enzyme
VAGSGKSTLASKLGEITGLLVIELDKIFWQPLLEAMRRAEWIKTQQRVIQQESWIMDGDLGQYDAVEARLPAPDTIIVLDFSLVRCAWRALRRGGEHSDFWLWLLAYRRRSLAVLMQAISKFASHAGLRLITSPKALRQFLAKLERELAKRN